MTEVLVCCDVLFRLISEVSKKIIEFNLNESNSIVNLNRQIKNITPLIQTIQQNPTYSTCIQQLYKLMTEIDIWLDSYSKKPEWKKNRFSNFLFYSGEVQDFLNRLENIKDHINTQILLDEYHLSVLHLQEETHQIGHLGHQIIDTVEKKKVMLDAMDTQKKIYEESRAQIEVVHNQILQDIKKIKTNEKKSQTQRQAFAIQKRMDEIYHLFSSEQQEMRDKIKKLEKMKLEHSQKKVETHHNSEKELLEAKKKVTILREKKETLAKRLQVKETHNIQICSQKSNEMQAKITNMQEILGNLEREILNSQNEIQTLVNEKEQLVQSINSSKRIIEGLYSEEKFRNGSFIRLPLKKEEHGFIYELKDIRWTPYKYNEWNPQYPPQK